MGLEKPPLGLHVEVETADGTTYCLTPYSEAIYRPESLSFRTQRGDGFADGSFSLKRRIDQDFPDLNLLDTIRFTGHDGSVAYEGRHLANPRTNDSGHSIQVSCTGFMTHATQRPFQEIYVDRDLSKWTEAAVQRKLNASATYAMRDPSVNPDSATGQPALTTGITGPWGTAPALGMCEAYYDAGSGLAIGSIYYAWKRGTNTGNADTNWMWDALLSTDDILSASDATGNLRAAGPGTGTLTATTTTRRYAAFQLIYTNVASASTAEYDLFWTVAAIYGTHGLTKQGTDSATSAKGFYTSDILKNIVGRFAPKLDTSGVDATSLVMEQAAWLELTKPYDAMKKINDLHLWELSVFENRKLYFTSPTPLDDYDWEVRYDDPGVSVNLAGDSAEDLRNGIIVQFTDFTGKTQTLYPTDYSQLRDDTASNPANLYGEQFWGEPVVIPYPTTQGDALNIGTALLAEATAIKAPGTISVRGHIRDRAGNWQQALKPRCVERVSISNYPNDRPRRITDTSYGHSTNQLTMTVDSLNKRVEGFFNRMENARQAAGLAS